MGASTCAARVTRSMSFQVRQHFRPHTFRRTPPPTSTRAKTGLVEDRDARRDLDAYFVAAFQMVSRFAPERSFNSPSRECGGTSGDGIGVRNGVEKLHRVRTTMSESHTRRRMRIRRAESLRGRIEARQHRKRSNLVVVRRILLQPRLTDADRGRLLGACVCLMEEVHLARELVRV